MTLLIADTHNTGVLTVRQTNEMGSGAVYLNHDEQRELMESLARIHGFSIVYRHERRSLMALTDEALDEHPDDAPASVWRTLAKTLASTVADALRFENDKEV